MANLILPNGQTIQTDNPSEIAEFMSRGAQDQSSALAASPGQTIQEIASERGQAWNGQGGQGYLDAMAQGHNDPTSDPSNPQAFSASALAAGGVDPTAYHQQNVANGAGIDVADWGGRSALNQSLYAYLRQKGYNPDFTGFGGQYADNFGNWLSRQDGSVRSDVNAWLDANDPNRSGTGGGGLLTPWGGGGGLLGGGQPGGAVQPAAGPSGGLFSNVGNIAGQQPWQMPAPTIGVFGAQSGQSGQQSAQSFEDLLSKYNLYSAPLQNGHGFNWLTPNVNPGAVNVMNANFSRRNL